MATRRLWVLGLLLGLGEVRRRRRPSPSTRPSMRSTPRPGMGSAPAPVARARFERRSREANVSRRTGRRSTAGRRLRADVAGAGEDAHPVISTSTRPDDHRRRRDDDDHRRGRRHRCSPRRDRGIPDPLLQTRDLGRDLRNGAQQTGDGCDGVFSLSAPRACAPTACPWR